MPALGESFRLAGGGVSEEVTLIEINDLVPVLREADEDRFALLFRARRGRKSIEGIRTLQHAVIGEVVLFVSPVGRSASVVHYEAVINRS